ncbi:MAG: hypothetical protein EOO24_35330 [Comamonadaceae bacterium]|nr:MAG: hypothetical protein EOO24_35330 [Comamonadaceae bacterium]
MHHVPRLLSFAALALAAAAPAVAQDAGYPAVNQPPPAPAVYRCGSHEGRVYTHVPCTGGETLGTRRVSRTFDRQAAPPQDRARQMARAALDADTRQQCEVLQSHIRADEVRLRGKGSMATEAEEGDLAMLRVRYRELRC